MDLITEYHYTDNDVGCHLAIDQEIFLWSCFADTDNLASFIVIRPDTPEGQALSNKLRYAAAGPPAPLTEEGERRRGHDLVALFDLKMNDQGRYDSHAGNKTLIGLYHTVKRIIDGDWL